MSKNVTKAGAGACGSPRLGLPMVIAAIILAVGIVVSLVPLFVPMSETQAALVTGIGVPLFIFGMVVFGILLVNYARIP